MKIIQPPTRQATHRTASNSFMISTLKLQNKKCYCCNDQYKCGNIVCANWVYFVHYTWKYNLVLTSFMVLEAFLTINRSVLFWLEWYFTFVATVATCCFVHFSWSVVSWTSVEPASVATSITSAKSAASALWFVLLKAFVTINRLVLSWLKWYLTFIATVATCCFVHFSWSTFVRHIVFPN